MKNQVEKWLSKKKNRQLMFFLLGAVLLYFYVKKKTSASGSSYTQIPKYLGSGNGSSPSPVILGSDVLPYPPSNGTMSPKLAEYGYPGHINLDVTGSSQNWSIVDKAVIDIPAGYQIRYYINSGETIITSSPLAGYLWQSNFPITVTKCLIKNGVEDLYFWGTNEPELIREEDGASMSGNTSMAYQTFIFNRF